jgi:serine/threonine protein kinase/WD40 repeat protein
MSGDTNLNLRRIFDLALAADPADRPSVLAGECGADSALRRRIEAMLAAAENDQFLAEPTGHILQPPPPTVRSAAAESPGSLIGRYKLLQNIGEGGFGAVFLAEQREPVARKVALKIIKLGMDTRQVIARFEAERQALALMDHPHIARVIDAGATESGRPYFVMEYVKGDPIIAFADAHKLSIRERLELFTQVCQAVQHAHTKGIIHRDLKPGNILVSMSDGRPFARVIDFGIAKATGAMGGRLTDKTLFTEHHQLIGTPEYMSPEQAEGSPDIDTRTDVYSLGVLLYELLTGATPFDADRLRSAAFAEMQRIIKEEDPPSPSLRLDRRLGTKSGQKGGAGVPPAAPQPSGTPSPKPSLDLVAAARRADPARLGLLIKGELDWIVMKALDKDRARRYETPSQLAADVQRHLAGEAVIAAPPSLGYRVRKFVRRNRGPVVATSLVAIVLVLGIAGTSIGFGRARAFALREAARAVEVEWSAAARSIAAAQASMSASRFLEARKILRTVPERTRGWEHIFLTLQADRVRLTFDSAIRPLEFDSAGHQLLVAQGDYRFSIWNVDSQHADTLRSRRDIPLEKILQATFGSDGSTVVTITAEGIQTWTFDGDSVNGPVSTIPLPPGLNVHRPEVRLLGNGDMVAQRNPLEVWSRTAEGTWRHQTMSERTGSIWSVELSPDGKAILCASEDRTACIWDIATGRRAQQFVGHGAGLYSASFSPDGSRVVTACDDRLGRVFDVQTGACVATLRGHSRGLATAVYSANGESIYTSDFDDTLVWNATSYSLVGRVAATAQPMSRRHISAQGDWMLSGPADESPFTLVSARAGSPARLFDADDNHQLRIDAVLDSSSSSPLGRGGSSSLALRELRVSVSEGMALVVGRDANNAPVTLRSEGAVISCAIVTPHQSRVITGASDKTVRFWETSDWRETAVFELPASPTDLRMTGDGTRLIISLSDGSSQVWDIRDPKEQLLDFHREWAERTPAVVYVDALLAGPAPSDKLREAIIKDTSLTALRRLVTVEVLQERLADLNRDANRRLEQLKRDHISPVRVLAAAESEPDTQGMPRRMHERLVSMARQWNPHFSEVSALAWDTVKAPDAPRERVEVIVDYLPGVIESIGSGETAIADAANCQRTLALAELRAGKFESASSRIVMRVIEHKPTRDGMAVDPIDVSIYAMAAWTHASSKPEQRELLQSNARNLLSQARGLISDPANASTWAKDPDALALFAEAESLIDPKAPLANPR